MVIWSSLTRAIAPKNGLNNNLKQLQLAIHRSMSGHHNFQIVPTRWQWHKFKDNFHFFFMLGVLPLTALVFYTNVFIGPATLTHLPTDRVPKEWEYYNHPITRFMARYIYQSHQEIYEKFLHYLKDEDDKIEFRKLEDKINKLMQERKDYLILQEPVPMTKYYYIGKQSSEKLKESAGSNF